MPQPCTWWYAGAVRLLWPRRVGAHARVSEPSERTKSRMQPAFRYLPRLVPDVLFFVDRLFFSLCPFFFVFWFTRGHSQTVGCGPFQKLPSCPNTSDFRMGPGPACCQSSQNSRFLFFFLFWHDRCAVQTVPTTRSLTRRTQLTSLSEPVTRVMGDINCLFSSEPFLFDVLFGVCRVFITFIIRRLFLSIDRFCVFATKNTGAA